MQDKISKMLKFFISNILTVPQTVSIECVLVLTDGRSDQLLSADIYKRVALVRLLCGRVCQQEEGEGKERWEVIKPEIKGLHPWTVGFSSIRKGPVMCRW